MVDKSLGVFKSLAHILGNHHNIADLVTEGKIVVSRDEAVMAVRLLEIITSAMLIADQLFYMLSDRPVVDKA